MWCAFSAVSAANNMFSKVFYIVSEFLFSHNGSYQMLRYRYEIYRNGP